MTITQGGCGGLDFRDDGKGNFYQFVVCQSGTYAVYKYISGGSNTQTLSATSSSAITTGLGQQNKIAIVASDSTLIFYVNKQKIGQEQDGSYTSGYLGLVAKSSSSASYTNARLWTL